MGILFRNWNVHFDGKTSARKKVVSQLDQRAIEYDIDLADIWNFFTPEKAAYIKVF